MTATLQETKSDLTRHAAQLFGEHQARTDGVDADRRPVHREAPDQVFDRA